MYERGDHDSARCLCGEGCLSEGLFDSLHRVTTELPDIFSKPSLVDGKSPPGETPTGVG
jgi:hypothetical protein